MPPEELKTISGYNPDTEANREKARSIMREFGYGPDNMLELKVSTRNIAVYRDPAVILIDHLKQIYINATLETVETGSWHSKIVRRDYQVGMNITGLGVDDPDAQFFENYACTSERNYTGVLQSGNRKAVRGAIQAGRSGGAPENGLAD